MTTKEAIKELQERYELGKREYIEQIPEYVEALRMAIAALEAQYDGSNYNKEFWGDEE